VVRIVAVVVVAVLRVPLVVMRLEEVVKGDVQSRTELDSEPPDAEDRDGERLAHSLSHAAAAVASGSTTRAGPDDCGRELDSAQPIRFDHRGPEEVNR
jgi:hypothetical protein